MPNTSAPCHLNPHAQFRTHQRRNQALPTGPQDNQRGRPNTHGTRIRGAKPRPEPGPDPSGAIHVPNARRERGALPAQQRRVARRDARPEQPGRRGRLPRGGLRRRGVAAAHGRPHAVLLRPGRGAGRLHVEHEVPERLGAGQREAGLPGGVGPPPASVLRGLLGHPQVHGYVGARWRDPALRAG